MADVCIIYSRHNREIVRKLAAILSARWTLWWDDIIVGKFAEAIERELPQAKCVVPIWSSTSRDSDMVRDELALAKASRIPLVPASIEDCRPPYGYGSYSSVDLRGWDGGPDHPGLEQLLRKIAAVVPPRTKPMRPPDLAKGKVPLPAVFLSVSSHETQLMPVEAVRALRLFRAPNILVSAYDLAPKRRPKDMARELALFREQGGFVLVDSGNYEASRLGDKSWRPRALRAALAGIPHDWVFCFDVMKPSADPLVSANQIVAAVERDRLVTGAPVLPIIHLPKLGRGRHDLENIPAVVRTVSSRLQPPLVAIPERELGPGLIARAQTVRRIREELNKLPFYQPIHLLGTGNPWSIAVLAAAGADTFDGLEWCRVVVDRSTGRLHHFQHFDFFTYQARVAESAVTVGAMGDEKIDFAGKVAFHNLDFYAEFENSLRISAARNGIEALVAGMLGQANTKQLAGQMPELFQ